MKIFGFLFRLLIVAGIVVWLADRPGSAQIDWRGYEIQTSAAVLAFIVAALAYALLLLNRVWRFVWDGPQMWRLHRKIGKMQDGQGEIVKGLAALAAGKPVEAGRHAVKARRLIGETPATRLVQAQAAQLAGDHATAQALYETMTGDPDTAALGYRGLMTAALRAGDHEELARLAGRMERARIDAPWLGLLQYDLGARLQHWTSAGAALAKARKSKLLPPHEADRREAALWLAQAQAALAQDNARGALEAAEKAHKLAPKDLPAFLLLAEAQSATDHRRAALRTIERAWGLEPGGPLLPLLYRAMAGDRPTDIYKQVEKFSRSSRENAANLRALADAALRADLWGEARRNLMALVRRGEATQDVYRSLAQLERRETGNESLAASWLSRLAEAPLDPRWLCASCGAAHETWTATCDACGAFNALAWRVPGQSAKLIAEKPLPALTDYLGG